MRYGLRVHRTFGECAMCVWLGVCVCELSSVSAMYADSTWFASRNIYPRWNWIGEKVNVQVHRNIFISFISCAFGHMPSFPVGTYIYLYLYTCILSFKMARSTENIQSEYKKRLDEYAEKIMFCLFHRFRSHHSVSDALSAQRKRFSRRFIHFSTIHTNAVPKNCIETKFGVFQLII